MSVADDFVRHAHELCTPHKGLRCAIVELARGGVALFLARGVADESHSRRCYAGCQKRCQEEEEEACCAQRHERAEVVGAGVAHG